MASLLVLNLKKRITDAQIKVDKLTHKVYNLNQHLSELKSKITELAAANEQQRKLLRARSRSLNKLQENASLAKAPTKEERARGPSKSATKNIRPASYVSRNPNKIEGKLKKAAKSKPLAQPHPREGDPKQESLHKKLEARKLSKELEKMQGKKPVLVLPKKKTESKKTVNSKQ